MLYSALNVRPSLLPYCSCLLRRLIFFLHSSYNCRIYLLSLTTCSTIRNLFVFCVVFNFSGFSCSIFPLILFSAYMRLIVIMRRDGGASRKHSRSVFQFRTFNCAVYSLITWLDRLVLFFLSSRWLRAWMNVLYVESAKDYKILNRRKKKEREKKNEIKTQRQESRVKGKSL